MEEKFKILTYEGKYVDEDLLGLDLFFCDKPSIHSKSETLESLTKYYMGIRKKIGGDFISDNFINNLNKCELTLITIKIQK